MPNFFLFVHLKNTYGRPSCFVPDCVLAAGGKWCGDNIPTHKKIRFYLVCVCIGKEGDKIQSINIFPSKFIIHQVVTSTIKNT